MEKNLQTVREIFLHIGHRASIPAELKWLWLALSDFGVTG